MTVDYTHILSSTTSFGVYGSDHPLDMRQLQVWQRGCGSVGVAC